MKTIAIMNRKGGTGKTTTAYNLAAYLQAAGKKVLLIDLDSQRNLTYITGMTEHELTAANALGIDQPQATVHQATGSADGGIDVLAAAQSLALADRVLQGVGSEYKLREALEPVKSTYDYCVLDTPPQLGSITANALTAADGIIVTCTPDILSVQGMGQLKTMVDSVKKYSNKQLRISGILITRYQRSNLSKTIREQMNEIAEVMQAKLYNTVIRECTAIREAQLNQQDIYKYAPRSNAAKDYAAFCKEFLEEE